MAVADRKARSPSTTRARALTAINARIAYLGQRIDNGEADGKDFQYDKAERAGLKWLLNEYVTLHDQNEILRREIEALREERQ